MVDADARQNALDKIIYSSKLFLTPAEVAPVLGTDPQYIRMAARQRPDLLRFEFTCSGNRTKIPRIPFLRFVGVDVDNLPEQPEVPSKSYSERTASEICTDSLTHGNEDTQVNATDPTPIPAPNPDPVPQWELVTKRTFTEDDGEMLWEISIKGWKRKQ